MPYNGHLTPQQLDAVQADRDALISVALSTESCDRSKAEANVAAAYRAAGHEPPSVVIWMDSPLGGAFAVAVLRSLAKWGQLRGQLGGQLWGQLRGQLGGQLWGQLWGQLRDQLGDQLGDQLRGQLRDQLNYYFAGSQWCAWEVFYDFCRRIGVRYTGKQDSRLDLWLEQSRTCHWWWPYKGLVIESEAPTRLLVDNEGRLHCGDGLALGYSDGWGIYAWHGTRVPAEVIITAPEAIDIRKALQEPNAEIRRVWLERAGWEMVLDTSAAIPIHADECGSLYRIDTADQAEPLMLVRVINSTPEPGERLGLVLHDDGTWRKPYVLLVHPELRPLGPDGPVGEPQELTARNAIASTFSMRGEDYAPACQS